MAANTVQTPIIKKPADFSKKVKDLEPQTHGHNLVLGVVSSKLVVEKTRSDGSKIKIAECVVGDETGSITLTARNEQIELMKPGASIIVRNSKVEMFKGYMRLSVDKWGKVEPAKSGTKISVLESNNRSAVEYELVTEDNDNE